MYDLCISYPNKLTFIHGNQGRKILYKRNMQRPGFPSEENKLDLKKLLFLKLLSFLVILSDENNVAKLVIGM